MKHTLFSVFAVFFTVLVALFVLDGGVRAEHGGIKVDYTWINSTSFSPSDDEPFFGRAKPIFSQVENAEDEFSDGELRLSGINDDENVYFLAQIDFSRTENCQDDEFILVSIDRGSYENYDPGSGSLATNDAWGGLNACLPAQTLVHAAEEGDFNIAASSETDQDSFASIGSSESEDEDTSCESRGGSLGWILCPLLAGVGNSLDWIENQMTSLLSLESDEYDNQSLEAAWSIVRTVALSLLIPAMLIMVISTALGFDFVSAYTVKTALPRMIIAVLFIVLSYDLTTFAVDVVQNIGHGIQNLLLSPFADTYGLTAETKLQDILVRSNSTGGNATAGAAAAAGYGAAGYFLVYVPLASAAAGVGLISFLLGIIGIAVLTLLVIFLLLTFRHMLIILLIILAPIAILPWIFPGRDNIFGLWSKTFWLMMWFYPLIMVAIAAGKILAAITMGPVN